MFFEITENVLLETEKVKRNRQIPYLTRRFFGHGRHGVKDILQNIFSNIPQITKTGHAAGVFSVKKMSVLSELASISSQNTVVSYFEASRSATAKKAGNTYRIGSKGALSIKADGKWYDFAAGIGGNGLFAAYCYEHYQTPYLTDALLTDAIDGAAQEFGLTQTVNRPQNDKRRAEYNRRKQQEQQQHKQAEAETATEQAKAAAIAQQIYAAAMPTTDHPYILRKQIQQVSALKEISGETLQQWRVKKKHTAGVVISDKTAARYLVIPVFDYQDGKDALVNVQLIHENGKEKRFLQRGKKKGCYFYMAGNGASKGIAEGFATADAVRQCVSHGVFVAFDAGNLRPVVNMIRKRFPFSQVVIYADDDSHKHAANGKDLNPGLREAKKAGRSGRVRIAYPLFKAPNGDKTTDFNDLLLLEGVDACQKAISRTIKLDIAHPILTPKQYIFSGKRADKTAGVPVGFTGHVRKYLSEIRADVTRFVESRRFSLIYAPTGCGKTDFAANLTGRVLVVFPTCLVGRQKARQYGVHFVYEGRKPNRDRVQFGTYDSLLKWPADDLSDVTIVIDEAHDVVFSADKSFRGAMLAGFMTQLQFARRVVLLTSTPPILLPALFPGIESAVITSDCGNDLTFQTLRTAAETGHKKRIAAFLSAHVPGKTTAWFLDNKPMAVLLLRALQEQGFSGVCLNKDADNAEKDVDKASIEECENIRNHGKLSQHYDVIFLTSYASQGLDMAGVNVGALLFDADFPLHMRKQGSARFRDMDMSGVNLYVMETTFRRDKQDANDDSAAFSFYTNTGNNFSTLYNELFASGRIPESDFKLFEREKGKITNTYTRNAAGFVVNPLGCAYLAAVERTKAARVDYRIEQQILASYGMIASGLVTAEPADEQAVKTANNVNSAINVLQEQQRQEFDAWLDSMAALSRDDIVFHADDSERMKRLQKLTEATNKDTAIRIMRDIRDSKRRYTIAWRRVLNAIDAGNDLHNAICQAFPVGMVFREEEKQTRFRGLLENHAIFRRVLGIPKRRIGHLTPNRITLFLNDFVETLTYQNRQTEETFTAILSACPIEKYLSGGHYDALNFYGADDETLERICKKFADLVSHLHELFALKTPTNQGKSAASSEIFSTQENDSDSNVF